MNEPSGNRAPAPGNGWTAASVSAVANFGGVALVFFCVQVVTGMLLVGYYRPDVNAAPTSMGIIIDEVRLGWLVRSVHWWSSDLLILSGLLHLVRTYFSRGYAAPRQMAWVMGILLFVVILGLGFTGTLLPWDQYAYWETEASRETIAAIPLIGNLLLGLFLGGWEIGQEVLLRFYALHIGVLPWLALLWLAIHLGMLWRARVAEASLATGRNTASLVPWLSAGLLDVFIVGLLLSGVVMTLAIVYPPELGAPADPLAPLANVQPRWYFLPARVLLRSLSGGVGSLVVVVLFALFILVPFIDRGDGRSTSAKLIRWILGLTAIAAWVFLALRQSIS